MKHFEHNGVEYNIDGPDEDGDYRAFHPDLWREDGTLAQSMYANPERLDELVAATDANVALLEFLKREKEGPTEDLAAALNLEDYTIAQALEAKGLKVVRV